MYFVRDCLHFTEGEHIADHYLSVTECFCDENELR